MQRPDRPVPMGEAFRVWAYIALHSFGGPAGQIGVMHRVLVEERRWIGERRFLHALDYCMILPGPEAMQLATYVGWLTGGVRGGLMAGGLFVLPGFVSILALSLAYAHFGDTGFVTALFFGLKAAVLAIVAVAILRLGRRSLRGPVPVALAAGAFVAMFFLAVPFPWVIIAAGGIGFLGGRVRPDLFRPGRDVAASAGEDDSVRVPDGPVQRAGTTGWGTVRSVSLWLVVWWAPVGLLALVVGVGHVFVQEAWFFSKMSVVTFGGAYAVLAYVAQRAVEGFGWLRPGEMLDGLGMAETTPGPLIMVVQFVGFMGAYRDPGGLDPLVAGIVASVIVTWVTFVPCFLWIFVGAPYMEAARARPGLSHALSGITAAVVGVILNLAVWFAMHVLFPGLAERSFGPLTVLVPTLAGLDVAALLITVGSLLALLWWRRGMFVTMAAATLVGLVYRLSV